MLCSCFPLAIHFTFGSVYTSLLLSHFVPAYPSPTPCPQVHSLHLCLYSCLSTRFVSTVFFRFHIYALAYNICFSLSDLLHCMTDSRSIHLNTNNSISLLFMAEQHSIVYMYHIFFIHSSVDGHLGCFHVPAIENNAAMNVTLWYMTLFELWFSQGICPVVGLLGHMVVLFLVF